MCEIRTFGWIFRPHFIPQSETKNPQNVRVFAQVGGFLTLPLCASIFNHNHPFTMECPYLLRLQQRMSRLLRRRRSRRAQ